MSSLRIIFNIENFQVGTPIITSDIANLIINTQDVVSLVTLDFKIFSGEKKWKTIIAGTLFPWLL